MPDIHCSARNCLPAKLFTVNIPTGRIADCPRTVVACGFHACVGCLHAAKQAGPEVRTPETACIFAAYKGTPVAWMNWELENTLLLESS